MSHVQEALTASVGVDGGHQPFCDTELVVDELRHRCQTVSCARCIGDDVVLLRVIPVLVDAHDDGHVDLLGRGGDDHLLRSALQMGSRQGPFTEDTRRLHDDLNVQVLPRQVGGITFREYPDLLAVHDKVVTP